MTGPWHYREAERELMDDTCEYGCPHSGCDHEMAHIARAQAHATLAVAATLDPLIAAEDAGPDAGSTGR